MFKNFAVASTWAICQSDCPLMFADPVPTESTVSVYMWIVVSHHYRL